MEKYSIEYPDYDLETICGDDAEHVWPGFYWQLKNSKRS